jgi:hypothetical protein
MPCVAEPSSGNRFGEALFQLEGNRQFLARNLLVPNSVASQTRNIMSDKFNPAPTDKHADDPKQAVKADKKLQSELDKGLEGTFPASDPPSSTEPAKSERDAG